MQTATQLPAAVSHGSEPAALPESSCKGKTSAVDFGDIMLRALAGSSSSSNARRAESSVPMAKHIADAQARGAKSHKPHPNRQQAQARRHETDRFVREPAGTATPVLRARAQESCAQTGDDVADEDDVGAGAQACPGNVPGSASAESVAALVVSPPITLILPTSETEVPLAGGDGATAAEPAGEVAEGNVGPMAEDALAESVLEKGESVAGETSTGEPVNSSLPEVLDPAKSASLATGDPPGNVVESIPESDVANAPRSAPDGPLVEAGPSAEEQSPPTSQAAGTSVAEGPLVMNGTEDQNDFSDQVVLPGDLLRSDQVNVVGSSLPAHAEGREPVSISPAAFIHGTMTGSATSSPSPVAAGGLLAVDGISALRTGAIEKTHDLVALHALRLHNTNTDSLHVVLKPGGGLELALQLQRQSDGIEARATLQAGDSEPLSRHWADLQQRLEARGIRLAPLSAADQFAHSNTSQFQQPQDRASRHDALAEPILPEIKLASFSTTAKTAPKVHVVGRGWESWA